MITQATPSTPADSDAKDSAFWRAILIINFASTIFSIYVAHKMSLAIAPRSAPSFLASLSALAVLALLIAASRVLLWRLTRPFATTQALTHFGHTRVSLCNVDLTMLLIASVVLMPKGPAHGLGFPADLLFIAGPVLVGGLIWVALKAPLEAANARDAARNAGPAS